MSLLHQYATLESQLHDIQAKLKSLETNKDMKKELEFKQKIEKVMDDYDKSAEDVMDLLSPHSSKRVYVKPTRKPRKLKVYKNPENGEVIETRGGNHKKLREWKEEYGAEIVESWVLQPEEP